MMVFAIRIENSLDLSIERPQHADARKHCRAARCCDQDQGLHRCLPFFGVVFWLRQLGDVLPGVAQRGERLLARQHDRIEKPLIPRHKLAPLLREQVRPGLRERQITTGRMHREPAVRDSGFDGLAIFLIGATGLSKLLIDDGDRNSTGVVGFDRIRQLQQLSFGGLGRREWAILLEFH